MNLADRIRGVVGPPVAGSAGSVDPPRADPSEILGGEWRDWQGQPYLVVDRTYPPGHRHGRIALADAAPGADAWPSLCILEPSIAGGRVLFIDLETTGLAGGAGTYAFLVGCGWFDGPVFRIRQFLLATYAAERGLLEELAHTAGGAAALATYNGKTFDLPLIETRFLLYRMPAPFTGMPHVDMLYSARRLWRAGRGAGSAAPSVGSAAPPSCQLALVERTVLGHEREADVPGFEIPSRYFHYVRSGDPRPLEAVFEHNRHDLLSLALLTARAARLLDEGPGAARTSHEALGLGRLYERAGRHEDARACFARAAGLDRTADAWDATDTDDVVTRAEALRAYAVLCRRGREHTAAADAWRRLLALEPCPPLLARQATEALAVHHEHRLRDLSAARQFALRSLTLSASPIRARAVQHRLARIDRKLDGAAADRTPLF